MTRGTVDTLSNILDKLTYLFTKNIDLRFHIITSYGMEILIFFLHV